MTPDPLQERVARALYEDEPILRTWSGGPTETLPWEETGPHTREFMYRKAAAVLADLREAGELRTYEQVGSRWHDGKMVATYIVREDNDG